MPLARYRLPETNEDEDEMKKAEAAHSLPTEYLIVELLFLGSEDDAFSSFIPLIRNDTKEGAQLNINF